MARGTILILHPTALLSLSYAPTRYTSRSSASPRATRHSSLATRYSRPSGDGGKSGHRVTGDGLVRDHQGATDGAGIGAPVRLDHHALHAQHRPAAVLGIIHAAAN